MQKMLDEYMIIPTGENGDTFRSIIQTNETSSILMEDARKGNNTGENDQCCNGTL